MATIDTISRLLHLRDSQEGVLNLFTRRRVLPVHLCPRSLGVKELSINHLASGIQSERGTRKDK